MFGPHEQHVLVDINPSGEFHKSLPGGIARFVTLRCLIANPKQTAKRVLELIRPSSQNIPSSSDAHVFIVQVNVALDLRRIVYRGTVLRRI